MSRPTVLVDARWLKSGIGRYTRGLLSNLRSHLEDADLWCITDTSHGKMMGSLCDRVIYSSLGIYSCTEQLSLPRLARGACVYHAPHYNIPLFWRGRLVVTIHDLNHILDTYYRYSWKSWLYARPMLLAAAHKADHIFTVSEYSKATIVEYLHVPPEKVSVTANSVDPIFQPLTSQEICLRLHGYLDGSRPYMLFVGDFRPNKNLPTVLRALSLLRQKHADCPLLVLAGGDMEGWKYLFSLIEELGLEEDVRWFPSVTDEVLVALYAGACMTIMPSLHEGFGFPVVESMSCGTPVICANAASLPEVSGGAALLFDPHSAEDLSEKIMHLMDSSDLWMQLSTAGRKRASCFIGERQVLRHVEVYRTLLEMS